MQKHKPHGVYEKMIKRPQDFLCALFALIILSPLFLILIILVRTRIGAPVFFIQERPGRNGKVFKLYKFRTMLPPKDGQSAPKYDELRLTTFGKRLRSSSLDELPELINVLKGDMAVVGPRPLLVRYLSRYNSHQARRHEVRPGLTGLAQIHGRNAISWEEKLEWDVKYVDKVTFAMDWGIIIRTIGSVIKKEGITGKGEATMSEFMGSDSEND